VLLVTGLTLVGEGLNETVNPILRKRRLLPVVMPPREEVVMPPHEETTEPDVPAQPIHDTTGPGKGDG